MTNYIIQSIVFYITFSIRNQAMSYYSSQIIQTLAEQVKSLAPLRQSFRVLQNYYYQLNHDLQNLVLSTNHSENELICQFKYLQEVRRQLQTEFVQCGEKLKFFQSKYAKAEMERSEHMVQNQALKSRKELEQQQRRTLQSKSKQLIEQSKKIEFTISKLKEMIHEVELIVKSKSYENLEIEREIKKMELVNTKINQLNKNAESSISQRQNQNQNTVEMITELDCKLDTYQRIIEAKSKQNKESAQTLIARTEEFEQLRHRKEYLQKLIQTQLMQQRQLTKTYGELDTILTVKRQKLDLVIQQNKQYELILSQQEEKRARNKEEQHRLKTYLQTLIQTNEVLFKQLERSCAQDKHVQIMLTQKLEKLLYVNDKITENDLENRRRLCLNDSATTFKLDNKSPLNKNTNLDAFASKKYKAQQKIDQQRRNVALNRQMNSTWGSWSKQNRNYDL